MPSGFDHGLVSAAAAEVLRGHVRPRGLGVVLGAETGFTIARDPDTVRAPDAAFVRADRVPTQGARAGFAELAPDLVVEVVSPSDRAGAIAAKVLDWLDAGVAVVWVVHPEHRHVVVHEAGGTARIVRGDAVLDGGPVLPDLRVPLEDLFGAG